MTKRKRCPMCLKLFAAQGFKRHFNSCMRKDAALSSLLPEPAQNVASQSEVEVILNEPAHTVDMAALTPDAIATKMADFKPSEMYPSVSTFESIVKELKAANLGFVVVVLD